MQFDVSTAMAVKEENEDGLHELGGQFDISTARPIEEPPAHLTRTVPRPQENPTWNFIKAVPGEIGKSVLEMGAEATNQMHDLLQIPAAVAGVEHFPWRSNLVTKTMPAVGEWSQTPLKTIRIPEITLGSKGELIPTTMEYDVSPLDVAVGALMVFQAGAQFKYGMDANQYNKALVENIRSGSMKAAVKENLPAFEKILFDAGVKLPKGMSVEDKVSVILSQAEQSPTLKGAVQNLAAGYKPLNAPLEPMVPGGQAKPAAPTAPAAEPLPPSKQLSLTEEAWRLHAELKSPKVGEVVSFEGKDGVIRTGMIREMQGNRAIIDLENKKIVVPAKQLAAVPVTPKEPWQMTRAEYEQAEASKQAGIKAEPPLSAPEEPEAVPGAAKIDLRAEYERLKAELSVTPEVVQAPTGEEKLVRFAEKATEYTDDFRGGTWYATPESKSFDFTKEQGVGGKIRFEKNVPIKNPLVIKNANVEDGSFAVINSGYEDFIPKKYTKIAEDLWNKVSEAPTDDLDNEIMNAMHDAGIKEDQARKIIGSRNKADAAMDAIIGKGLSKAGYDALILENEYKGKVIDKHIFKLSPTEGKVRPADAPEVGMAGELWGDLATGPKAGGMVRGREIPEQMKKWLEEGVDITERGAPIRIVEPEAKIKDINGKMVDLPKGHEMTPYKLSNGKIWLHDGKDVIVEPGQLTNLANKNIQLGGYEAFAPMAGGMVPPPKGAHYEAVKKALSEGKKVPAAVLKDYPDLQPGKTEVKTSGLAQGIEDELGREIGDLPTYRTRNMKDVAGRAAAFIAKDPELAMSIALGDAPEQEDLRAQELFTALRVKAKAEHDFVTMRDMALSDKASAMAVEAGQRVKAYDTQDPEDPVTAMREVSKAREEVAQKRLKTKDIQSMKKKDVEQAKKEIKKLAPTKETWADFIKSLEC